MASNNQISKIVAETNLNSQFSNLLTFITLSNDQGLFDINKRCELIMARIFTVHKKIPFLVLEDEKKNYPGVDIASRSFEIAFQVTSETKADKVKDTIFKFLQHKLYEVFKTFKIIFLSDSYSPQSPDVALIKYLNDKQVGEDAIAKLQELDISISNVSFNFSDLLKEIIRENTPEEINRISELIREELGTISLLFKSDIQKLAISETHKIKYELPNNYLERLIIKPEDLEKETPYFVDKEAYKTLYGQINSSTRIVLLSEAASGKSIELKKIASLVSNDKSLLFPFFYSLGNYTNENINDLIPNEYEKLPIENILFIFDGLDEISAPNREVFIKKIESFITVNLAANFIISSRENFYTYNLDSKSNTLETFNTFKLANLNGEQVEIYLSNNLKQFQIENFNRQIFDKNLRDLMFIPFYLINFVQLYKKNGSLPDRRANIFSDLVDISFNFDSKHFKFKNIQSEKSKILKELEKISLMMELMGIQKISAIEIKKILSDENLNDLINSISIIKKNGEYYEFVHNNFREYLCALALSTKSFTVVESFFFINNRISPKRVNVLSFLLSISEKSDDLFNKIFEKISEEDLEIFLQIENDKISQENKNLIFKKIFLSYKKKRIFIDRSVYDYRKLAYFGQSNEISEFLIKEILNSDVNHSKRNAIELIGYFHNQKEYFSEIERVLVEQVEKGDDYVKFLSIMSITNLKLNSKGIIEKIITLTKNNTDDHVKYGIYSLLLESSYLNEYIEVILDGIYLVTGSRKINSNSSDVRIGNESIMLVYAIEAITEVNTFKKVLDYFTEKPDDFKDLYFHHFKKFYNNLVLAFYKDNTLFESVLNLLCALEQVHEMGEEIRLLYKFFETTNTSTKAFFEVENSISDEYTRENIQAKLGNIEILNELLDKFEKKILDEKYIQSYLLNLRWRNLKEFETQYIIVNERTSNKFIIEFPKQKDYDKLRKEALEKYIHLLFNREEYLRNVMDIIKQLGTKNFTDKDLSNLQIQNYKDELPTDHIIDQMRRDILYKVGHSNELVSYYEKTDWDYKIISEIYDFLHNGTELILSPEQIKFIGDWCTKNLDVKFKYCLEIHERSYTICDTRAIFVWYFLRHLNLTYPRETLLDMVSFDWLENNNWVGLEYLEKFLNQFDIKERILDNMKNNDINSRATFNSIAYCKANNISEIQPYLLRVIIDSNFEHEPSLLALDSYLLFSKSMDELINSLSSMDYFKWIIIDKLFKNCQPDLNPTLNYIFENGTDDEKLNAAAFLTKYKNLVAFHYIVELIKLKNHPIRFSWSIHYHFYNDINTVEYIGLLLELLKTVYSPSFKDSDTYSMKNIVLNIFFRIGTLNDEATYNSVIDSLHTFINENESFNPSINFINLTIDNIKKEFYLKKTIVYNFDQALEKANIILSA